MSWQVITGDCIDKMRDLEADSIDAIVTDPPYGIGFMGHEWDQPGEHQSENAGHGGCNVSYGGDPHPAMEAGRYDRSATANQGFQRWTEDWAREAFRVLKPGGYLLSFASTRTYHRMTSGIEDAGFEIRDCIAWIFGSGFPKATDKKKIPEAWAGWNTALKPAFEPIAMARKPLIGTVAANLLAHGTGAINIDASRVETDENPSARRRSRGYKLNPQSASESEAEGRIKHRGDPVKRSELRPSEELGRWPANLVLDPEAGMILDAQSGELTSGFMAAGQLREGIGYHGALGNTVAGDTYGDTGGASRFFYCAKTSRAERNAGLDGFPVDVADPYGQHRGRRMEDKSRIDGEPAKRAQNVHPTVKPIALMRWLVRMVTPPGGALLDPFNGSGSTGCAAVLEGFDYIGIEREAEYVAIAEARIEWWAAHPEGMELATRVKADKARAETAASGQGDLFGAVA